MGNTCYRIPKKLLHEIKSRRRNKHKSRKQFVMTTITTTGATTITTTTTADSAKLRIMPLSPVRTRQLIVGPMGPAITNQVSVEPKRRDTTTVPHSPIVWVVLMLSVLR